MGEEIYARNIITIYKTFETVTNSTVKIITIGLPGQISPVAFFLQFHLDYFIVTRQLQFIYRDIPVKTTLS